MKVLLFLWLVIVAITAVAAYKGQPCANDHECPDDLDFWGVCLPDKTCAW